MSEIAKALQERLRRGVSLEVWTRDEGGLVSSERDVNEHAADAVGLMRQLKTLHPALTFTAYDLDRHAARAEEAGITLSPTVVFRSGGRSVQMAGLFYGPLFPPTLDVMGFLSMQTTPLAPETRTAMQALTEAVEIEAFVTPFDPFSPHLIPLLAAFAVEGKQIRLRLVEASQFPVLAGQRLLTEVPLLVINGKRFPGYWDELALSQQIQNVAAGSDEKVIRERVLTAEYVSEAEARRLAEAEAAAATAMEGGQTTASGLIIPGSS
jgi:hypothetical protein